MEQEQDFAEHMLWAMSYVKATLSQHSHKEVFRFAQSLSARVTWTSSQDNLTRRWAMELVPVYISVE